MTKKMTAVFLVQSFQKIYKIVRDKNAVYE